MPARHRACSDQQAGVDYAVQTGGLETHWWGGEGRSQHSGCHVQHAEMCMEHRLVARAGIGGRLRGGGP